LNVYGRKILLTDCDEFTRNYYRTKYGVQDFTPINYKRANDYKPLKQSYPCKNILFSEIKKFYFSMDV
jgi:hypothetical protein